jgi:hypothetical protein
MCVAWLQSGVAGFMQSALMLQPPMGSHVPFVLHVAERHTVPALPALQGPSPLA